MTEQHNAADISNQLSKISGESPPATTTGMAYLHSLTPQDIADGSPYRLAALLGKKVIHPGGRFSTSKVMAAAKLDGAKHVLEVGCGVGHLSTKLGKAAPHARITGIDIDAVMLDRARERVAAAGFGERVQVMEASVEALPFEDATFDRAVVESVTMFTDLSKTLNELHRVVAPGGIVVDHEFMWNAPPTPWRQKVFHRQFGDCVCDTADDWRARYEAAGFTDVTVTTGMVLNFTPPGMVIDEGLNIFPMFGRLFTRWSYIKRMGQFMWDQNRLIPWIRYGIVVARRP